MKLISIVICFWEFGIWWCVDIDWCSLGELPLFRCEWLLKPAFDGFFIKGLYFFSLDLGLIQLLAVFCQYHMFYLTFRCWWSIADEWEVRERFKFFNANSKSKEELRAREIPRERRTSVAVTHFINGPTIYTPAAEHLAPIFHEHLLQFHQHLTNTYFAIPLLIQCWPTVNISIKVQIISSELRRQLFPQKTWDWVSTWQSLPEYKWCL